MIHTYGNRALDFFSHADIIWHLLCGGGGAGESRLSSPGTRSSVNTLMGPREPERNVGPTAPGDLKEEMGVTRGQG